MALYRVRPAGSHPDCDHIDALALLNGGSDVSPGRVPLLPQQPIRDRLDESAGL
jgi:hypothetical protein